jgi:hypothetical protein
VTDATNAPDGRKPAAEPERLPLFEDDPKSRRRRGFAGLIAAMIFAAAFGAVAGLIGGAIAGLVAAVVVGLPLLFVVLVTVRRRLWLVGTTVLVRTWRTRQVNLVRAERIDLLVTDVRGSRTIGLLINAGRRGNSVRLDLAVFSGTGGRELGVLPLRRLANAIMNNTEANGIVFGELLVAELKSEARGEAVAERPLYRLASAAPSGKLAQRFTMEAVSRFVATLE